MTHATHKLKAYTGEYNKPCVFCEKCGKEQDEGLNEPCTNEYYNQKIVDKDKEPK